MVANKKRSTFSKTMQMRPRSAVLAKISQLEVKAQMINNLWKVDYSHCWQYIAALKWVIFESEEL